MDRSPVQDGPAEDRTAVDLESLAEPPHGSQPAVLGHEAEVVFFDLKDQRVAGFAEAGGGAGDGGKNRAGAGRCAPGCGHGAPRGRNSPEGKPRQHCGYRIRVPPANMREDGPAENDPVKVAGKLRLGQGLVCRYCVRRYRASATQMTPEATTPAPRSRWPRAPSVIHTLHMTA